MMQLRLCSWFLLLVLLLPSLSLAATRLGLLVTQEELNIWRTRMTDNVQGINGRTFQSIYQQRLKADADLFLGQSHPGGDGFWAGWPRNECHPYVDGEIQLGDDAYEPHNSARFYRGYGSDLLRAAFVYLLSGTTAYADAVKAELLAQIAEPGTNWANTTKWCTYSPVTGVHFDASAMFEIGPWLWRLLLAYDYLVAANYGGFSGPQHTAIRQWFANAADFMVTRNAVPSTQAVGVYPWMFATPQDLNCAGCPGGNNALAYFGGPMVTQGAEWWSNRPTSVMAFAMAVGIMLDNATLRLQAHRWATGYIKAGTYDNGANIDFFRWVDCLPALECVGSAWGHGGFSLGALIMTADLLARTGDTSLYDYSAATVVVNGSGGTVSLQASVDLWANMANKTVLLYGTDTASHADANTLFSWDTDPTGLGPEYRWEDLPIAVANMYYKKSNVITAVTRNIPGSANHTLNCYDAQAGGCFSGGWTNWPDIPFQYGNMHNLVNPYDLSTSSPPVVTITAPTTAATHEAPASPLTTLAGTATDPDGTVSTVTWTCTTCTPTSGTATFSAPNWSVASIGLAAGSNIITVMATDTTSDTGTDILTVSLPAIAVACYSFDGTGADTTGLGHTATLQGGATYAPGVSGQALSLDGVNDYAEIAHAADLNLTGDMTLFVRLSTPAVASGNVHDVVVTKELLSGTFATPWHLDIVNDPTRHFQWYHHTGGNVTFDAAQTFTGYTIPLNTMIYAAVRRIMTPPTLALFVNGSLVQTLTTGWTDPPEGNTQPVRVGIPNDLALTRTLQGLVDNLCIYNSALTDLEIVAVQTGVTVDSTFAGYTAAVINDEVINASGGTATTWASQETAVDHFVVLDFGVPQTVGSVTVHWALNTFSGVYMTSNQVLVQTWNGSTYTTAATMTYTSAVPSTTMTFTPVSTSRLRLYQLANQGPPTYPEIMWLTEVDMSAGETTGPPAPVIVRVTR